MGMAETRFNERDSNYFVLFVVILARTSLCGDHYELNEQIPGIRRSSALAQVVDPNPDTQNDSNEY
jgi:hypothetical protein